MNKLRNVVLGAVLALLPAIVSAQPGPVRGIAITPFEIKGAAEQLTAVSTDVGIYIKYIGTAAGVATVAVDAATGDVALVANGAVDVGASGTVDTGAVCAGGVANSLDVSDAQCDTVGELVDIINVSSNWLAVPHAMLRSDTTINTLITLSATDAKSPKGLGLLKDTVVTLNMTNVVFPKDPGGAARGMLWYTSAKNSITQNPFEDTDTVLLYAAETITTTDNAANLFTVYCVVPNFVNRGASTEAANVIYQEAGALTTATGKIDEFLNAGGLVCNGGKMLVRETGTTTLTAPSMLVTGYTRTTTAR